MSKIMISYINAKGIFIVPEEDSGIYIKKESVLEYLDGMKDLVLHDETGIDFRAMLEEAIKLLSVVGVK